jgi:hypothetical protein
MNKASVAIKVPSYFLFAKCLAKALAMPSSKTALSPGKNVYSLPSHEQANSCSV